MNWEEICVLCQTELEKLEAALPPFSDFFRDPQDALNLLLDYEREANEAVERAVREFAAATRWPSLSAVQQLMLSFRLDFAAALASLLAQQPAPWTDSDNPEQREHRLCWLMLFAWENEGFPRLQKALERLLPGAHNR
jgi:hypothetical protein